MSINKSSGFSLIEVAMALVITGLVMSIGLPIARVYVDHYKHTEDKVKIRHLSELVIGYAMTRGGFPDPAVGNVLPSSGIGMSGKNSYDTSVKYYANALLTETATVQNFTTLCNTARNILDGTTASTTPAICNEVSDAYADCADSTVTAFVLISPGKNRVMEHENGDGDNDFENPTKKPNATNDYDDVVMAYGLPELVNECQRL